MSLFWPCKTMHCSNIYAKWFISEKIAFELSKLLILELVNFFLSKPRPRKSLFFFSTQRVYFPQFNARYLIIIELIMKTPCFLFLHWWWWKIPPLFYRILILKTVSRNKKKHSRRLYQKTKFLDFVVFFVLFLFYFFRRSAKRRGII